MTRPSPEHPDYWPKAQQAAPGLRTALLKRFATDLRVMTEPIKTQEGSYALGQRPADQRCCYVYFDHGSQGWIAQICGDPFDRGYTPCSHWHHTYEVLVAIG